MIKKKKIMAIISTLLILGNSTSAYAWGGYAHYEIANRFASSKSMDAKEKEYFTSGSVIADIGRLSWDKNYVSSDSKEFTDKMNEITNKKEFSDEFNKKFAEGWKAHYIEDNKGSLANISGGPSNYRVRCGWVDEYLRDNQKISTPINGKADMVVDYNLIRETYKELTKFEPTNSEINQQIKVIFTAYDLQILANFKGWTDSEKKSIEAEINRTAKLCNGALQNKGYDRSLSRLRSSDYTVQAVNNNSEQIEKSKEIAKDVIENEIQNLEQNNSIDYVTNYESDGEHFKIVIKDEEEYTRTLTKMLRQLEDKNIDINQVLG